MSANLPLHRFREFGDLTPDELAAVVALGEAPRRFERRAVIRGENVLDDAMYLLLEGWAAACTTLPDGGRQISKIHLPGDALGTPSMCMTRTVEMLVAITPVLVAAIPLERFGRLFTDHPRVAAYFLLSVQRERIALMDQLTSLGRTSAPSRLAAFLLDIMERLEPVGGVKESTFTLPLTQEQIGDLLGLTGVHVNRTIRELEERGFLMRDRQSYTVPDRAALARLAGRPPRTLRRDAPWLPPPA